MGEAIDLARLEEWDAILDHSTYYEILGVLEIADDAAIRAAFHQFALAFHPDQHVGASAETLGAVRRIFQRGAEAYRVLSTPELRLRYDMAVARGQLRLEAGDVPRRADAPADVRRLDELCRSAGAKLCAMKAAKLIDAGDLAGAKRELAQALAHDGGNNTALSERLEDLEIALFAMGE